MSKIGTYDYMTSFWGSLSHKYLFFKKKEGVPCYPPFAKLGTLPKIFLFSLSYRPLIRTMDPAMLRWDTKQVFKKMDDKTTFILQQWP